MGEPHIVSTLLNKRSELAGLIAHLERQIDQYRAEMIHVDAVIRIYAPEIEPADDIPAKVVRQRNFWFRPGECVRLACDLLREAPEPLPTGFIISEIMRKKDIPEADPRTRDLMQRAVLGSLDRATTVFERVTVGGRLCWRIKD